MNEKWSDDIGRIAVGGNTIHDCMQTLYIRGISKLIAKSPGSLKMTNCILRKGGDLVIGPHTDETLKYFCEYLDSIFTRYDLKSYFESKHKNQYEMGFSSEDTVLKYNIAKNYLNIIIYTLNNKLSEEIEEFINACYAEYIPNEINVLVPSTSGFTAYAIGRTTENFETGNYSPSVIKDYDYILKYFSDKDPFGRLLLLHGEPGTGKTHFVKAIINNIQLDKCKIIYLQSSFIAHGGGINSLLHTLITSRQAGKSIVLILEDADDCLVPRASDNMAAISNLLNLADGMLGSMLDVRIIATSNAKSPDMDKALLRPGRLCKQVEIGRLSIEQSAEVYARLTGKEIRFDMPMTLAEVYESAHGLAIKDAGKKKVVGFARN